VRNDRRGRAVYLPNCRSGASAVSRKFGTHPSCRLYEGESRKQVGPEPLGHCTSLVTRQSTILLRSSIIRRVLRARRAQLAN
jgi:hypothetical protein